MSHDLNASNYQQGTSQAPQAGRHCRRVVHAQGLGEALSPDMWVLSPIHHCLPLGNYHIPLIRKAGKKRHLFGLLMTQWYCPRPPPVGSVPVGFLSP